MSDPGEGLQAGTLAVHAGNAPDAATGAMAPPIHLSTTFRHGPAPDSATCERLTINGAATREIIGKGRLPRVGDRPWLLPRQSADRPLIEAAQRMTHRLADYQWTVSTGPLVWNRHKPQLSAKPKSGSVKIVWAADLDGGELHQDPVRDHQRRPAQRPPRR